MLQAVAGRRHLQLVQRMSHLPANPGCPAQPSAGAACSAGREALAHTQL